MSWFKAASTLAKSVTGSSIGDIVRGGFGAVGQGVGGSLGSWAGQQAGGFLGIPTAGQLQSQFNDEAYPGTTPWERLGSPGATSGAAQAQTRASKENVRTQSSAQVKAARIQADAAKYTADRQVESTRLKGSGADTGTGGTGDALPLFDSMTARQRQEVEALRARVPVEVERMSAETQRALWQGFLFAAQGMIEEARADLRKVLAETEVRQKRYGPVGQFTKWLYEGVFADGLPVDPKVGEGLPLSERISNLLIFAIPAMTATRALWSVGSRGGRLRGDHSSERGATGASSPYAPRRPRRTYEGEYTHSKMEAVRSYWSRFQSWFSRQSRELPGQRKLPFVRGKDR